MPLNMQENDEFEMEEGGVPRPPIKRTTDPIRKGPNFTTVTLIVLLLAIIGAGAYLLYRYRVFGTGAPATSSAGTASQPPALVNPWKSDPQQPSSEPTAAVERPSAAPGERTFAVYISSYRERTDADEEVSRWVAAGFSSFVTDAQGWHRVAFGRFDDTRAARQEAERWKQAFENGYWIGAAQ